MPKSDTERHEIRRMLMEKFGGQRDKSQVNTLEERSMPVAGKKDGAEQAALKQGGKGLER